MSNKLHLFDDDDIEGRRPIVKQLTQKREDWKKLHDKINFYNKNGFLPSEKKEENRPIYTGSRSAAEIELESKKLDPEISRLKGKMLRFPQHKNYDTWKHNHAMLTAEKFQLTQKLIELKKL